MQVCDPELRPPRPAELEAMNAVIRAAVMQWDLPERVKRLSLGTYQYSEADFEVLEFRVAAVDDTIVGVAAWEPASGRDVPAGARALLLHGLYVHPRWQGQGVGSGLFAAVEAAARKAGYEGLLVRAQAGAGDFFRARHMHKLAVEADKQQYANRYWKAL